MLLASAVLLQPVPAGAALAAQTEEGFRLFTNYGLSRRG